MSRKPTGCRTVLGPSLSSPHGRCWPAIGATCPGRSRATLDARVVAGSFPLRSSGGRSGTGRAVRDVVGGDVDAVGWGLASSVVGRGARCARGTDWAAARPYRHPSAFRATGGSREGPGCSPGRGRAAGPVQRVRAACDAWARELACHRRGPPHLPVVNDRAARAGLGWRVQGARTCRRRGGRLGRPLLVHRESGGRRAVKVLYGDDELAVVRQAAAKAELRPNSFVAPAAPATATGG